MKNILNYNFITLEENISVLAVGQSSSIVHYRCINEAVAKDSLQFQEISHQTS